jgi:glycosyltransferase involved in cell wall biosynthesis
MLNIAYFSNQFADRSGHGLARFSRELFAALSELDADLKVSPVAAWSSLDQESLSRLQERTGLILLATGHRLTPLLWASLNRPTLESMVPVPVDVVHAVSLGYPVATRKPYVVTVHDLGPLTHPEFFTNTRPWIMQRSLVQAVKQAAVIACVSQSTADELIDFVGSHIENRVRVVHEGVSPFFSADADTQCLDNLEGMPPAGTPFILSAGKISPRKNIQGLLKAMRTLGNDIPQHLVLVGGQGWETETVLRELGDANLLARTHLLGYVSDEQLRALYAAATVYVHPSFYEGFGLTVLEAMAAGCPVITSNLYSLPEVAGDAALLVDPTDSEAIASAITQMCDDEQARADLIARGGTRVAVFRWENCAESMYKVYHEAMA